MTEEEEKKAKEELEALMDHQAKVGATAQEIIESTSATEAEKLMAQQTIRGVAEKVLYAQMQARAKEDPKLQRARLNTKE